MKKQERRRKKREIVRVSISKVWRSCCRDGEPGLRLGGLWVGA